MAALHFEEPVYSRGFGSGVLSAAVTSGFANKDDADFEIKCGDRVFYTHKLVIRSISYFRTMMDSSFREANDNSVELKEDDPNILELALAFYYGSDLAQCIAKLCKRPSSTDKVNQRFVEFEKRGYPKLTREEIDKLAISERQLFTPTHGKRKLRGYLL